MSSKPEIREPITALDGEIRALVQQVRERQNTIRDEEEAIYRLKEDLVKLLEERGSNWSDEYGYARLNQAGKRVHYDMDALDSLIISDPLRYGWLHEFRKEVLIPARVQVR